MSLQPALHVEKHGRELTFTVTVHNAASEPAELRFSDAGLLQVVVTAPDGRQIYDSRAGRMFATVMKTVTVAPGKDATFNERWTAPPEVRGPLRVKATLRANPPLEAAETVEL